MRGAWNLSFTKQTSGGGDGGADPQNDFVWLPGNPNLNGTGLYNFAGAYDQSIATRTHLASGGPGGLPACRFSFVGPTQDSFGFWLPTLPTFAIGEAAYIRVLIRMSNNYRFIGGRQFKFFLMSNDDNSRMIIYIYSPSGGAGGTLGWRDAGGTGNYYVGARPSDFGLVGANDWSDMGDLYGSITCKKNINLDATLPILLSYGNNPSMVAPGPNSAVPIDGWQAIQFRILSALLAADHDIRGWSNNLTEATPTVLQPAGVKTDLIHTTDWEQTPNIGGYLDDTAATGMGYDIAALAMGRAYDPTWGLGTF